ncbi:hypothetical protein CHS0354_042505 [Potamilus streckersoni]|uniref:Uncharacterized protein n=1 Tax=Potamilus streckersoni TaxID=2493646 RepID=A0AAE0VRQ0_9BIVA|nr:hypothetical protein CHS0354_042505 [Potamilus streckersoni]
MDGQEPGEKCIFPTEALGNTDGETNRGQRYQFRKKTGLWPVEKLHIAIDQATLQQCNFVQGWYLKHDHERPILTETTVATS